MIKDIEGHKVTLAEGANPHITITGASGEGKTTAAICLLNEIGNDRDQKVLVIDQSGSYTSQEMKEHGTAFLYEELDPCHGPVRLAALAGEAGADRITAAIAEAADIRGYRQAAELKTACRAVMKDAGCISFPNLIRELAARCEDSRTDKAKAAEQLLCRLSSLGELDMLTVGPEERVREGAPITVLQLSGVHPMARDMLVRFSLALLWEEIRQSNGAPPYDALLLDELQNIPLSAGSALWCMLREARKFRVRLILCTQSLGIYNEEQRAMLTQTGHQLFFKPPGAELPLVDRLLGGGWRGILSGLKRGQAIMTGCYHIDGRNRTASTPLVVQFKKGKPE